MGTPSELFYWIPGEMILVARLPGLPIDDSTDALVEQIRLQLNTFLSQYQLTLELYGTAGRWRTTPTLPPIRRRSFIFGLHRKQPLLAIFFHVSHTDASISDPVPMTISYIQSRLDYFSQQGLHIVSAMPHWLVTTATHFYGEGGPAFPPQPTPTLAAPSPNNALAGWRVKLLHQHFPVDTRGAEDVQVAILDTALHPDRILTAASRPELRRNWLLQRLASDLRQNDGSFVVEYDRYAPTNDVRTGRDIYNDTRYYPMPDHGISLAGLVRDVAPRARIRLIRVLNDYGGGDLYSLIAALSDLERELVTGTTRRLVINLSLTIMPDIRRLPYIWLDHRDWPTTQLSGITRILDHIEAGLRLLCESLYSHGALLVAAAGNDSVEAVKQGLPPRPPRAPARFDSTLSVTSVNSNFTPALYANAANIAPSDTGVATFGGDLYGSTDKQGLPDAVRGVYISPTYPNGEMNTSGWADWSGTSFAAAIITGLGAHLLSQGWSASNSMLRLTGGQEFTSERLFGMPPEAPSLLGNIIRVQQRFGL
ncbi:S8 family serine peptidase [Thermosporothrix hazakensis]|jgi:hypothetical protein|nr:S8 family serine peptidase [Thermosporothrix hazakensis]